MISNDVELETTLERIRHFQAQLAHLRKVETHPVNYRLSASGFWPKSIGCNWRYASISAYLLSNRRQQPE